MLAKACAAAESSGVLVVGPQEGCTISNTLISGQDQWDPRKALVVFIRFRAQQAAVYPVFLVACVETVADCLISKEPICIEHVGSL